MSENAENSSILRQELNECVEIVRELDEKISGTATAEFQAKVKNAIERVERITIEVSQLDLFSENETLDELSTSCLRFLLLPALLACLNEKLSEGQRKDHLEVCEIYIKDFILRLKNYGVLGENFHFQCKDGPSSSSNGDFTPDSGDKQGKTTAAELTDNKMSPQYLMEQIRIRDEKIKLYKEQKDLEEKYKELLKSADFSKVDDDKLRELYLTELRYWAAKLSDFYDNIQREKPILDHIALIESGKIKPEPPQARKPPQVPLIITRSKLHKEALGYGYPSLPTMSLEQFFDEKSKEGQIQVLKGDRDDKQRGPMTEEEEKIAKETARETDDPDLIGSERQWDEYRDVHRRGWGNTHNKG